MLCWLLESYKPKKKKKIAANTGYKFFVEMVLFCVASAFNLHC